MTQKKRANYWLAICLLNGLGIAHAQSINLPISIMPSGQDGVRSADGVQCSSHTGSRKKQMEFGVFQQNPQSTGSWSNQGQTSSYGVYGKLIINLDRDTPAPINCNELLQLEIERLKRELDNTALQARPPK